MTVSANTPADIVNIALVRIGYKREVGDLYDGSEASRRALNIYGQTRDELLRDGDWPFAERNASLTLLKSAPAGGYITTPWTTAYPPIPWMYEYGWPTDCLKVKAVKPSTVFVPNFTPQSYLFDVANDNAYSPAQRVILSNVSGAVIVYTGRVTDPTTMPVDFVEALAAALGRRLATSLAPSLDIAKFEAQDEQIEYQNAAREQG